MSINTFFGGFIVCLFRIDACLLVACNKYDSTLMLITEKDKLLRQPEIAFLPLHFKDSSYIIISALSFNPINVKLVIFT